MGDKIHKLSQAIRLGATFRPQCRNYVFMNGETCALGAALEAVGLLDRRNRTGDGGVDQQTWWALRERFPALAEVQHEITDRNDKLGHTREQIADWLESIGL